MSKYDKKIIMSSIALALVAIIWGTTYAIIKDALNDIGPFKLMTLRFGLSTLVLGLIFSKRLKNIKRKDIYQGSIIGIFMFLSFFTLITGILFTTASKQSFIVGSYVIIVPFLAWAINKRPLDTYEIIGAVVATIGIGLLTLDSSFYVNKGDTISLFCALFFACHMIAIEHFNKKSDPIISTIIQFAVTTALFLVLTGSFESYTINLTPKMIYAIVYLVIVTTVIPFVIQNIVQRYISSTSTALILTLESASGAIFAMFYLNEIMSHRMMFGGVVIFLGIITEETKLDIFKRQKNSRDIAEE